MTDKYRAILFDLDGTLLPMDLGTFTKGYLGDFCRHLAFTGLSAETIVSAIWAGCGAMASNDGQVTNYEAFWKVFGRMTGADPKVLDPASLHYYTHDFNLAKQYTSPNPLAKEAIEAAHACADYVVLATNPLFPMEAQLTRLSWIGLGRADFDLITAYEDCRFAKPNPKYFDEIRSRIGCRAEECLMIGNDVDEDCVTAMRAGVDAYLVTDCMIPSKVNVWTGRTGTFAEMLDYLKR